MAFLALVWSRPVQLLKLGVEVDVLQSTSDFDKVCCESLGALALSSRSSLVARFIVVGTHRGSTGQPRF